MCLWFTEKDPKNSFSIDNFLKKIKADLTDLVFLQAHSTPKSLHGSEKKWVGSAVHGLCAGFCNPNTITLVWILVQMPLELGVRW